MSVDVREDPVVLIDELASLLKTSARTIQRQLRAGTFFLEEMPPVDHRHRWSRERVYQAITETTKTQHAQKVVREMRPAPRMVGRR